MPPVHAMHGEDERKFVRMNQRKRQEIEGGATAEARKLTGATPITILH